MKRGCGKDEGALGGAVPAGRGCLGSDCNAGSSGSPLQSNSIGVRKPTGNRTLCLLSGPAPLPSSLKLPKKAVIQEVVQKNLSLGRETLGDCRKRQDVGSWII